MCDRAERVERNNRMHLKQKRRSIYRELNDMRAEAIRESLGLAIQRRVYDKYPYDCITWTIPPADS